MSSHQSSGPEPRVLLSGLAYVESPRWHEGRLWFAHWGTEEIVAVGLDGASEVILGVFVPFLLVPASHAGGMPGRSATP